MTAPVPIVGYQQVSSYTAAQDRAILAGRMSPSGSNPSHGVIYSTYGGAFDVFVQSGTMTIKVDPGAAMVQGYSVVVPPGQTSLTLAPSTAVARRDALILRVYDTEAGDASSKAALELVKGSAAGVDPTLPPRSLLLEHFDVAANATTVTNVDRRVFVSPSGANTLATNHLDSVQNATVGLGELCYEFPNQKLFLRRSSAWLAIDAPVEVPSGAIPIKGSIAAGDRIYGVGGSYTVAPNASGDVSIALPFQKALLYAHAELNQVPADLAWRHLDMNPTWTSPQSVAFRVYQGATYTPQTTGTFGISVHCIGA